MRLKMPFIRRSRIEAILEENHQLKHQRGLLVEASLQAEWRLRMNRNQTPDTTIAHKLLIKALGEIAAGEAVGNYSVFGVRKTEIFD